MAKKQRSTGPPNPHSVPNRDIMQRMNFLYQASTWLSSLHASTGNVTPTARPAPQPTTAPRRKGKRRKTDGVPPVTPAYLSRAYVNSMKAIGHKTVVRMDPSVKRTICKGCAAVLIPGMTASVRSKSSSSHKKLVRVSCLNCKVTRRIPAPPSSQDARDSPPKPGSAVQANEAGAGGKKRKRPKVVYKQPFFERPEHILFRGNEIVSKVGGPLEATAQEHKPARMELDGTLTSMDGHG